MIFFCFLPRWDEKREINFLCCNYVFYVKKNFFEDLFYVLVAVANCARFLEPGKLFMVVFLVFVWLTVISTWCMGKWTLAMMSFVIWWNEMIIWQVFWALISWKIKNYFVNKFWINGLKRKKTIPETLPDFPKFLQVLPIFWEIGP